MITFYILLCLIASAAVLFDSRMKYLRPLWVLMAVVVEVSDD